jgi:HSP20 family molecular chaperone IbpA
VKRTLKLTLSAIVLTTVTSVAVIDVEAEILGPVREMQMLDSAMERGMDQHNQKVQDVSTVIDQGITMDNTPMIAFAELDNSYKLVENIEDPTNTKVKVSLQSDGVKIEMTKQESRKSQGENGMVQSSSSTSTVQVISIPFDADSSQMKKVYKGGVLTITMPKKKKWTDK